MSEFEKIYELLLSAIVYKFSEDRTRPGVVLSIIPVTYYTINNTNKINNNNNNNNYYCSIVRYENNTNEKIVVVSSIGKTMLEALSLTAKKFVEYRFTVTDNPLEKLARELQYYKQDNDYKNKAKVKEENPF